MTPILPAFHCYYYDSNIWAELLIFCGRHSLPSSEGDDNDPKVGSTPRPPPPWPVVLGWGPLWFNCFPFIDQWGPLTYSVASGTRDCMCVISRGLYLAFILYYFFLSGSTNLIIINCFGGAVAWQ